jgi:hypothetical protein
MLQQQIVALDDDDFEILEDDLGDLPRLVDAWAEELSGAAARRRFEEQETQVFRVSGLRAMRRFRRVG